MLSGSFTAWLTAYRLALMTLLEVLCHPCNGLVHQDLSHCHTGWHKVLKSLAEDLCLQHANTWCTGEAICIGVLQSLALTYASCKMLKTLAHMDCY